MNEASLGFLQSSRLSALILSSVAFSAFGYFHPDQGRWLSRDPIEEDGGPNLYGFVSNDPIGRIDLFGLFGPGQWHEKVYYKGHGDFAGNDIFAYNKEDDSWDSNPFTPWGMPRHFRDRREVEPDLDGAISKCEKERTERLLHQWQDTYVHWDNGWRWWKLGHTFAKTPPDLDNSAWQDAESTTSIWVGIWKKACCKSKGAKDGWVPKDGSEGCCDKQ